MSSPRRWPVLMSLMAVYLIWGSTYLAIRIGVHEIPPFLMAGGRFLLAGIPLYVWARRRSDEIVRPKQWLHAAIVGGLMLVGGNGLVTVAEQTVSSSVAALLITTVPLWMVGLDAAFYQRRAVRPLVVLGLLVGFSGVALLLRPGRDELLQVPLFGGALLLLASFSWANGSLWMRRADLPRSIPLSTSMQMLCAGLGMTLFGLGRGEASGFDLRAVSPLAWGSVFYLAIFGSFVALSAYTWLLRNCSAALVGTYAFVNPIVAVVLGWWLADEVLSPRVGLAAAMIVGAVVLIQVRWQPKPKVRHEVEEVPAACDLAPAGADR